MAAVPVLQAGVSGDDPNAKTVEKAMIKASGQHAERIYINAPSADSKDPFQDGMRDFVNNRKGPGRGPNTLKEITVYGDDWMVPTQKIDFGKGLSCEGWDWLKC